MKIPNHIIFEQVEQSIGEGKSVRMTIKGDSMYPFMRSGKDSFVLVGVDDSLKVGDIALFHYDNKCVLHRLIAIEGDAYVFMGDGSVKVQEQVALNDIIAVVDRVEYSFGVKIRRGSFPWRAFYLKWRLLRPLRRVLLPALRLFW